MRVQYRREDDVLLIHLTDQPIDHAEECDGMIVHLSPNDQLVLIEMLDASELLAKLMKVAAQASSGQELAV